MSTKYSTKTEPNKRKKDYFTIYNNETKTSEEVKFLSQIELAEGWRQNIPSSSKKYIVHFNVTLAFLPEHLWFKLKKINKNGEESYKMIKDGLTRYTIDETNQDELMINLFREINKLHPNKKILQENIDSLDENQYTSWLVIRCKHYIDFGGH
jgi:hypothetical protein